LASELRSKLSQAHFWDGATALDGGVPVLAMRLYGGKEAYSQVLGRSPICFMPYLWETEFGPVATITAFATVPSNPAQPRVCIYPDDPVVGPLLQLRLRAAFFDSDELVAYFDCDLEPARRHFHETFTNLTGGTAAQFACKPAAFWQALDSV